MPSPIHWKRTTSPTSVLVRKILSPRSLADMPCFGLLVASQLSVRSIIRWVIQTIGYGPILWNLSRNDCWFGSHIWYTRIVVPQVSVKSSELAANIINQGFLAHLPNEKVARRVCKQQFDRSSGTYVNSLWTFANRHSCWDGPKGCISLHQW